MWDYLMIQLGYFKEPKPKASSVLLCPVAPPYGWLNQIDVYGFRGISSGSVFYTTHFRVGGKVSDTGNATLGAGPATYSSALSEFPLIFDSLALTNTNYYSLHAYANPDCLGLYHSKRGGVLFIDGHSAMNNRKSGYFATGRFPEDPGTRISLQN